MLPFAPTPDAADRLFAACIDPARSLRDIAQAEHTSVEALSLWLASSAITERLAALHDVNALRVRFLASDQLCRAISALSTVVQHAQAALPALAKPSFDAPATPNAAPPPSPAPSAAPSASAPAPALSPLILRIRLLETCRRAATTIIALARWSPSLRDSRPAIAPRPPAPPPSAYPSASKPAHASPAPQPAAAPTRSALPALPRIPTFAHPSSSHAPPAPTHPANPAASPDSLAPLDSLAALDSLLDLLAPAPSPTRAPNTPRTAEPPARAPARAPHKAPDSPPAPAPNRPPRRRSPASLLAAAGAREHWP